MQTISKEDFLSARQELRQAFNAISPLIHEGKEWVRNAQRLNTYDGQNPSDESKGFGGDWSLLSTLIATALAHSRKRLHMTKFQSKMPGHEITISDLKDQEAFLRKFIAREEEARGWSAIPTRLLPFLKTVAFTPRPIPVTVEIPVEEVVTA